MSYLIYQLLKIKEFLAATGVLGVGMITVFLLWAARPKRGMLHYGWQAFFLNRTMKEILFLNAVILQLMFALTSVFAEVAIDRIHIVLLAAIWALRLFARPRLREGILDAGYSVLLLASLLAGNLLAGFMRQAGADIWILGMYFLLRIFIVEFAVYYFFRSILRLLGDADKGRIRLKFRWIRKHVRRETDVRG